MVKRPLYMGTSRTETSIFLSYFDPQMLYLVECLVELQHKNIPQIVPKMHFPHGRGGGWVSRSSCRICMVWLHSLRNGARSGNAIILFEQAGTMQKKKLIEAPVPLFFSQILHRCHSSFHVNDYLEFYLENFRLQNKFQFNRLEQEQSEK